MKNLGQHFLKNKSALRLIAESLELAPNDSIVEIGPGHGELTGFLRVASRESRLVLLEKDEKLFSLLEKKWGGDNDITIIHGDALRVLPVVVQNPKLKIQDYKIAGNIPYYITGHLFRILGELKHKPERCVFTIQKEVAERVCATPPHMNRLAASVQFWANAKIIKVLSANDFSPSPKVSSAVILLKTNVLSSLDTKKYYAAVRALFAQPRKTLVNNLVGATGQKRTVVIEKLSTIGITPGYRPQNLI